MADFRMAGVEPSRVDKRADRELAVEFDQLTYEQAAAIAVTFRPEHSAILLIGGHPFES